MSKLSESETQVKTERQSAEKVVIKRGQSDSTPNVYVGNVDLIPMPDDWANGTRSSRVRVRPEDLEHVEEQEWEVDADLLLSDQEILEAITGYEQQYGMSSAEVAQRRSVGSLPDTLDFIDWCFLMDIQTRVKATPQRR